MGNHWTLQDAKNKFSALVEAASRGEPQHVTKRGVDAVVVIAAEEFERLLKLDATPKQSFVEHILAFPKLPDNMQDLFDRREPMPLEVNEIDFSDHDLP